MLGAEKGCSRKDLVQQRSPQSKNTMYCFEDGQVGVARLLGGALLASGVVFPRRGHERARHATNLWMQPRFACMHLACNGTTMAYV